MAARAGDFLTMWLVGLGGTFQGDPVVILAQPFLTGGLPGPDAGRWT